MASKVKKFKPLKLKTAKMGRTIKIPKAPKMSFKAGKLKLPKVKISVS